jgi:PKD repeat protein
VSPLIALLAFAAAAQPVTVTGKITYEDRTYDASGFTGITPRPVRFAEIDLLRSGDNAVLDSGVTDENGAFTLSFTGPNQNVRVRVYARRAGGQINVVVQTNSIARKLYAVSSPTIDTHFVTDFGTIALTIAGGGAPAFNIFDCAVKSFQYLTSPLIQPSLPSVPLLTIYWEPGSQDGTYFNRGSNAVFLLGENTDPDEYDDDMILHEIGHWIAFNFSKDDTTYGPHSILDQLDPRKSWSEGWAHYWSAAVRRYINSISTDPIPEYSAPNLQVDTFAVYTSSFDVEGPSFPTQAIMATNELAVAAVLWDITDPANEAFDSVSGQEGEVWRAVSVQIPLRTNITLEDFHAGLSIEAPGIMTFVTGSSTQVGIFNARLIRYYPDPGPPPPITPLPLGAAGVTLRTIYPAGDEDWYQVDATPGTLVVETLNLGDGADTLLELYDASGVMLLDSNDNRSPGDPSSRIVRIVSVPTTYRARVRRSGTIVEYGYYDIRAQMIPNGTPLVTAVSASALTGTAPLRVSFSATLSNPDASSLEFQWDFNGDGIVDASSLQGPTATFTYDEPGTFTAQLRVIDSGDFVVTAPLTLTVLPAAPATLTLSSIPAAGAAPFPVSFNATVSGVTPSAYFWDFDGDGIVDAVSVTTPAASFTYREAGSFVPQLVVRDTEGRATRAACPVLAISAGSTPPTIGSFTASGGSLPFASTFTVAHSDLGPTGTVEVDIDGDGRYDFIVAPGSASGTTFFPEIQRAGSLFPRVRVTDSSGRSLTAAAPMSSRSVGLTGWMVDPRAGDRLSGTSVTLSAQAVPAGYSKSVQFQARNAVGPGAWIDVGSAIASAGTLFSTTWDVSGLPDLSSFDLRILIDGIGVSGDTANAVVIDSAAPTISENGPSRTKTIRTDRTVTTRNAQGVWAIVPLGSTADALPLGLSTAVAPSANGSALGMLAQGAAWRVTFAGTFSNAYRLRLPFSGDGTNLEIHHFDQPSGQWRRLAFPRVEHDDGWVEAEVNAEGIYSLFGPAPPGGGGCGATGMEVLLLLAFLAALKRQTTKCDGRVL